MSSLYDRATDFLAAEFYTSDEDIAMHQQVAAAQQAIVDRQLADGKRNIADYIALSSDIKAAGNYEQNFKDKNSGFWGALKIVPWWVWLVAGAAAFWYFGGFAFALKKLKRP